MSDTSNERATIEQGWLEHQEQTVQGVNQLIDYIHHHPNDEWRHTPLISNYDELVERLLANRPGDAKGQLDKIVEDLLVDGTYEGNRVDIPLLHRRTGGWDHHYPEGGYYINTANHMLGNRVLFAILARFERQTFKTLFGSQTIAFHGTNGLQLSSIVHNRALLSHDEQYARGLKTGSGELSATAYRRKFISFDELASSTGINYANTDIRSDESRRSLESMAKQGIEGAKSRLDELWEYDKWLKEKVEQGDAYLETAENTRFGIVFGLSKAGLFSAGIRPDIGKLIEVRADTPELSFLTSVSTDYLPVIGVDDKGLEAVSAFLIDSGVANSFSVFSLSALRNSHRNAKRLISELDLRHSRTRNRATALHN